MRALLERNPGVDPSAIDDVVFGCANQAGEDNRNVARMALLLAGIPDGVPGVTVNRLCGSGMDAVGAAARAIRCGEADLMIAGGVESMSRAPFVVAKATAPFSRAAEMYDTTIGWRFVNNALKTQYGTDSMPDEIAPVSVSQRKGDPVVVDRDEHPRATSLEKLAALKPLFADPGTVTAGNASGVNDGAAALLVASKTAIERFGLTPRARFVGVAAAGVPPRTMGYGPVPATRKLLGQLDLDLDAMDVIELNEAFAAQALTCTRELGLADDDLRVNALGGAIALGHPLGMSGARLLTTALHQLGQIDGRYALCTMCIGVGQGIASVIQRVD
jgi:acetyl-CoA acyltransferase